MKNFMKSLTRQMKERFDCDRCGKFFLTEDLGYINDDGDVPSMVDENGNSFNACVCNSCYSALRNGAPWKVRSRRSPDSVKSWEKSEKLTTWAKLVLEAMGDKVSMSTVEIARILNKDLKRVQGVVFAMFRKGQIKYEAGVVTKLK